jgi:hypothetical protein
MLVVLLASTFGGAGCFWWDLVATAATSAWRGDATTTTIASTAKSVTTTIDNERFAIRSFASTGRPDG